MAGLTLVRTRDRAFAEGAIAAARRHQGEGGNAHDLPGWRLLHFPYAAGGPAMLLDEGEDLVAVAGTLAVDGATGTAALRALRDAFDPPRLDWSRVAGQFVALIRSGGRTFLIGDYFSAFQLFHDAGHRVFSTSLLTAAETLPSLSFDGQGVYEWAFNVVPIGNDTVFGEMKTLGPRTVVELLPDGVRLHSLEKPLPPIERNVPLAERIARARAALAPVVSAAVQGAGQVNCPLSGGLDSRLLLAALRDAGATPNVYVYGGAEDADVRIARAIGAAEGFAVAHIDKSALAHVDPDGFAEQVAANFAAFDALPTFGNIFDNGGHRLAWEARHAGGALAASGGAGEICRNFFYLPDRRMSADAVAATFFARFDPRDTTARFDARRFLGAISSKLLDALGRSDAREPLSRGEIEQLYPRVRCRALFGREISLEARQSPYLMPFMDHRVVAEAMTLPMQLKAAGAFEAALLAAIDPALAAHMSAYGHDFASGPGLAHRMHEWSSVVRPPLLRRYSYRIRRHMRATGDEHGGLLSPEYMSRVIDLEFPAMRAFFRMERVNDSALWRRIACLEYLAARLGSRLRG